MIMALLPVYIFFLEFVFTPTFLQPISVLVCFVPFHFSSVLYCQHHLFAIFATKLVSVPLSFLRSLQSLSSSSWAFPFKFSICSLPLYPIHYILHLQPHTLHLYYASLFTWFSVFLSVSFLSVHLPFSLAQALLP